MLDRTSFRLSLAGLGLGLVALTAGGCFEDSANSDTSSSESSTESTTGGTTTGTATDSGSTTGTGTTGPDLCGNGSVDAGEECDLGPQNADNAQCTSDCTINVCGDGLLNLGEEECDDGNTDDMDMCTSECTDPACGDGLVSAGEACDDGADNGPGKACNDICEANACGDGDQGPDEQCDDGMNNGPGQNCKENCETNVCGDGDKGPSETCDDGNTDPGDGCDPTCKSETCGDSVTDATEECDDGANGNQDDGCTDNCTTPVCGDGFAQASLSEECDDGAANADDAACTATCKTAVCGDNLVHTGVEECDDGNQVDNDGCTNACGLPACGDGITQAGAGEQCDDGGVANGDGCSATCQLEQCGNNTVDAGEDCDDGANGNQDDGCTDACKTPACGDGYVQASLSEDCDTNFGGQSCMSFDNQYDSGTVTCSGSCAFDTSDCGICGNNTVDPQEACDDGDQIVNDCNYGATQCTVCGPNCTNVNGNTSYCGDGMVDGGNNEECDTNYVQQTCAAYDAMYDSGSVSCNQNACLLDLSECGICGNSITEPKEECDDGPGGSAMCNGNCMLTTSPNVAFVTNGTFKGTDIGGLAGADAICNTAAQNAGLTGTFVALLSTSTVDLRDRLNGSSGWVGTNNLPVGNTPTDMFTGHEIFYPVQTDESGNPVSGGVWTGSNSAGQYTGFACDDWSMTGNVGLNSYAPAQYPYWLGNPSAACSAAYHLYCFEVGNNVDVTPPPVPNSRRAFLSGAGYPIGANIGALDAACANEANANALPGTYKALVGNSGFNPINRFNLGLGPWVRKDNVLLAATAADFANDVRLAPLAQHPDGAYAGGNVWTGATGASASAPETCKDWTVNTNAETGVIGWAERMGATQFKWFNPVACTGNRKLYCLQE